MSGRAETILRRIRSISIFGFAFVVLTVLLPVLLVVALLIDLGRAATGDVRLPTVRVMVLMWVYLFAEVVGVVALFGVWLASGFGSMRRVLLAGTYAVQRWWAALLFRSIRRMLSLELSVEGAEALSPGPILLFMRHASIVDNLLPNVLVTARRGIKLRYVLKKELLADPALDIAGNRLPNYFVDRQSRDSAAELDAIRRMASDLGPTDGVLLYPEGTRFTAERRQRALERLRSNDDLYPRALALEAVLPPRLGGALALLDSGVDVVVAAHRGLDGFSHLPNLFGGGLVGTHVEVVFWRIRADELPRTREERVHWLYDQWARVDEWVRR